MKQIQLKLQNVNKYCKTIINYKDILEDAILL